MPSNMNITTNSVVSFQKISEDTVVTICKLSYTLSPQQKKFVASNAQSIAQAYFNKHFWFRAIYANDTPVGFIMLYDDPVPHNILAAFWQLLIPFLSPRWEVFVEIF